MRSAATAMAVLGAFLAPGAASAQADPWFGRDKALHFGVTLGLGSASYAATAWAGGPEWLRLTVGAAVPAAAGAGKELYDALGHGSASWRDLAWDGIGTATGVLLAWGIDRLFFGGEPATAGTCSAPGDRLSSRRARFGSPDASRDPPSITWLPERRRQARLVLRP